MQRLIAASMLLVPVSLVQAALFLPASPVGTLPATGLANLSGLASSRANPGVLWAHNDRAGTNHLFAITSAGNVLATLAVNGATNIDWEDLATGPGPVPGRSYLYVSDLGAVDTGGAIYRIAEPTLLTGPTSVQAERISLNYPSGSYRSETLLVDPITGETLVITKEPRNARVYRTPADETTPTMSFLFDMNPDEQQPFRDLTAGDVSPDGSLIVLRNNQRAWAFERTPGQTLAEALQGSYETITLAFEPKGEALAFAADGSGFYTASEQSPPAYPGAQPIFFYGIVPEPTMLGLLGAAVLLGRVAHRR
jgi:hypothetical protein